MSDFFPGVIIALIVTILYPNNVYFVNVDKLTGLSKSCDEVNYVHIYGAPITDYNYEIEITCTDGKKVTSTTKIDSGKATPFF